MRRAGGWLLVLASTACFEDTPLPAHAGDSLSFGASSVAMGPGTDGSSTGGGSSTSSTGLEGGTSSGSFGSSGADATSGSSGSSGADATGTTGSDGSTVRFEDRRPADFELGSRDGVAVAAGGLTLADGSTRGTFRSRVFDAGAAVRWETLRWEPAAPYGKPLPDGGASEAPFVDGPAALLNGGAADMTANLWLLHFEDGVLALGEAARDGSGLGYHPVLAGEPAGASTAPPVGPFGAAFAHRVDRRLSVEGSAVAALSPAADDFTWAFWLRIESCDHLAGETFMSLGSELPQLVWLGCGPNTGCPADDRTSIGGEVRRSEEEVVDLCTHAPVIDGAWHHVALVKQGQASAVIRLYLDGRQAMSASESFSGPFDFSADPLTLGGFASGEFGTSAAMDEVAIWGRALAPQEVLGLYQRGVARARLRLRGCDDPGCADDPPFIGEGGSPEDAFQHPAEANGPAPEVALPATLEHRYLQYEVELRGSSSAPAPRIGGVGITGTRVR